jgi:hypothetical protein
MSLSAPFFNWAVAATFPQKGPSRVATVDVIAGRAALLLMTDLLLMIAIGLLTALVIMAMVAMSKLNSIKELWERVQDKLSHIYSGVDKLDTGMNWFLSREGIKVDYCHSNWRWMIVSRDDTSNIYRTLKELDRDKREALAKALYEANLQAMRDFDKEQKKEAKKK